MSATQSFFNKRDNKRDKLRKVTWNKSIATRGEEWLYLLIEPCPLMNLPMAVGEEEEKTFYVSVELENGIIIKGIKEMKTLRLISEIPTP